MLDLGSEGLLIIRSIHPFCIPVISVASSSLSHTGDSQGIFSSEVLFERILPTRSPNYNGVVVVPEEVGVVVPEDIVVAIPEKGSDVVPKVGVVAVPEEVRDVVPKVGVVAVSEEVGDVVPKVGVVAVSEEVGDVVSKVGVDVVPEKHVTDVRGAVEDVNDVVPEVDGNADHEADVAEVEAKVVSEKTRFIFDIFCVGMMICSFVKQRNEKVPVSKCE